VKTLHFDETAPIGRLLKEAEPQVRGQAEFVGIFERI
jgi:hypothetical protein